MKPARTSAVAETLPIRFEPTRTIRRGTHARKVIVHLAGNRTMIIDTSDELSAANVCRLAAMARAARKGAPRA